MIEILIFSMLAFGQSAPKCVPKIERLQMASDGEAMIPQYFRVSPDGRFLITTEGSNVRIYRIDHAQRPPKINVFETPLAPEAYPVEPDWTFVASPYDKGTTKFYRLTDLLKEQKNAAPVLEDEFTEFYSSLGGDSTTARMVSWTFLLGRKYQVSQAGITKSSAVEVVCQNLMKIPEKFHEMISWHSRRGGKMVHFQRSVDEEVSQRLETCNNSNDRKCSKDYHEIRAKVIEELLPIHGVTTEDVKQQEVLNTFYYERYDTELRQALLVNPILSGNGQNIAGVWKERTRVFRIDENRNCTEIADLGYRTGKVSFDRSSNGNRYLLFNDVYVDQADGSSFGTGVYLYDLETKTRHNVLVSKRSGREFVNYSYPNFLKDGRIAVLEQTAKEQRSKFNLVFLDPHQVTGGKVYEGCVGLTPRDDRKTPPGKNNK